MSVANRSWKSSALVVITMLVFTLFIDRVSEWTNSDFVEFVAYGQTGTGGGGTGTGGGGGGTSFTKIVPQIGAGSFDNGRSRYVSIILVVNPTTAPVNTTVTLYNQNGTPSTLPMNTNLTATPTFTGSATLSIPAGAVLILTTNPADPRSPGIVQWAKIVASADLPISSSFETRFIAGDRFEGRVGVPASDPDMMQFVVTRLRHRGNGRDTGFAIVNTGTSTATLTGLLKDSDGTILATKTETFAPNEHKALFASDFFFATGPENEGRNQGSDNVHYIQFSSTSASFAAMALGVEGSNLTSFPVFRVQ